LAHRGGQPYIPDVVYASFERLPPGDAVEQPYLLAAPDLPSRSSRRTRMRGVCRQAALLPASRRAPRLGGGPRRADVTVYVPGDEDERVLREGDTLDGGAVLPGFTVSGGDHGAID
jgi:hypothetical protein